MLPCTLLGLNSVVSQRLRSSAKETRFILGTDGISGRCAVAILSIVAVVY